MCLVVKTDASNDRYFSMLQRPQELLRLFHLARRLSSQGSLPVTNMDMQFSPLRECGDVLIVGLRDRFTVSYIPVVTDIPYES